MTNPCNKTIRCAWKQNKTRAIRPSEIRLRTSNKPFPIGRQTGIPIGQPNWTVLMSSPIWRRSALSSPLSHSLTGSVPVSEVQKTTGIPVSSAILNVYQKRCCFCKKKMWRVKITAFFSRNPGFGCARRVRVIAPVCARASARACSRWLGGPPGSMTAPTARQAAVPSAVTPPPAAP